MADDAPADAGTDETTHDGTVAAGDGVPARGGDGAELGADLTDVPAVAQMSAPNGERHVRPAAGSAGAADTPDTAAADTTEFEAAAGGGAPATEGSAPAEAAAAASTAAADGGSTRGSTRTTARDRAKGKGGFWRELVILVVIALALATLIRTFAVQAFFIPSGSMEHTLHGCPGCSGDRVLVNKIVYDLHDPRPGDVVVFKGPPSWESEVQVSEPSNVFGKAARWLGQTVGVAQPDEKDFVKRVIAVGGQTVSCCDPKGRVTVDGQPLDEPYVFLSTPGIRAQPFGPITVPRGRLWVMGDHRDGSADSRAHVGDGTSGTVPVDNVIGKAFVIVWPISRWATIGTPGTFHDLSSGPLATGAPLALGAVGTLPVAGIRRRRRRRRGRART